MVFLDPDAAVIIRRTFLFRIMEAEGSDRNAVLDTDIRLVSGFRIPAVFHVNSRIRISLIGITSELWPMPLSLSKTGLGINDQSPISPGVSLRDPV